MTRAQAISLGHASSPIEADMHLFSMHRVNWPWWLVAALTVSAALVLWQQPEQRSVALPQGPIAEVPRNVTPTAPVATTQPASSAPAPPRLVGTAVSVAGRFAIVQAADARLVQVHVGDRVGGLIVTAIESTRVALTGPAGPIVIEAEARAATTAAPSPANPPAPVHYTEPEILVEGH